MKTIPSTSTDTEASLRKSLSDEQVAELMADDMLPEYDIDYSKARPNRFAKCGLVAETSPQDADTTCTVQIDEAQ